MMKRGIPLWFILLVLAAGVAAFGRLWSQTVSDSFPTWFERLDFVAIDQQTVYSTQAQPRSNFVFVFHNGLLQTQEQNPTTCAPSCADYTAATSGGKRTITFLQPNGAGDRVTLWYWR